MGWNSFKKLLSIGLFAAMVIALAVGLTQSGKSQVGGKLQQFSSYNDLRDFVKTTPSYPYYYNDEGRGLLGITQSGSEKATSLDNVPDYSQTNIQVEGVDEADIIKTDGEYIYLITDNSLIIVKAYPSEDARILSETELKGSIKGIFINGDRLAVFEEEALDYLEKPDYSYYEKTSVKVYDVSDRESPVLKRDVAVDGLYWGSRMIGNYIYVIATGSINSSDNEVNLPRIYSPQGTVEIPASEIWHSDAPDYSHMFTTIMALNIKDDSQEPAYQTLLLGGASNLYVSLNNIYITFPSQGAGISNFASDQSPHANSLEKTAIHRIHMDDGKINYEASGEIPGWVLNQFSMDEYQGYFRVATTTGHAWGGGTAEANQVYVLDQQLDIIGQLEDLAQGEQIYSARFIGNRCYLVTFQKIDPLFVIDLKDPFDPKVLGELKITGYSDYLHPYDENHVIGIGKETIAAEEGDFAWYQGLKISLFDVSDVQNPKVVGQYEIGDRGTDSPVLQDHKAFLFDRSKNLLVIPVSVAEIDAAKYPYGVPPYAYGDYVWQGAYVFNISLEKGLELKGTITHCGDANPVQSWYYYSSPCSIERSLYIGNILYTISDAEVKLNSLGDLSEIKVVDLP